MPLPPRASGIQKQVLSLYREGLRHARALPLPSSHEARDFIRGEFRRGAQVDRLDFQRIEHLLRQGKKKLASLASSDGGFKVVR
jgi:succinate dehydrogenase assembly factor 1